MRDMIDKDVVPMLSGRFSVQESGGSITLVVAARPESELAEQVQDALSDMPGIGVSYRAMMGQIEVKLKAREDGADMGEAERRVREALGPWVVAEGDETLEGNLGSELRSRGMTLAVAESLTGGMVSERITRVAGSSDYFRGGMVAYSYEAKERLLGGGEAAARNRGCGERGSSAGHGSGSEGALFLAYRYSPDRRRRPGERRREGAAGDGGFRPGR